MAEKRESERRAQAEYMRLYRADNGKGYLNDKKQRKVRARSLSRMAREHSEIYQKIYDDELAKERQR